MSYILKYICVPLVEKWHTMPVLQGANWHAWILSSGVQLGMRKINHIQHIFGCGVQKERKESWVQVESVMDIQSYQIS
jgi:hypothetical protein